MSRLPARPRLRNLVRVVAIGQTQEHNGVRVSLLALEVYDGGCVLSARITSDQFTDFQRGIFRDLDRFPLRVWDDRGQDYESFEGGGSSSAGPDFYEAHPNTTLMPTLEPSATALSIEIAGIAFQFRDTNASITGAPHRTPGDTIRGPWLFHVPIPASP